MVNEQFNENYVKIRFFYDLKIRNSGMIQKIFPFDYKSKSMMTVVKIPDSDKYRMYVKGAPEYLMSSC
jgi:magnesium-transporting ATPase (P-type)